MKVALDIKYNKNKDDRYLFINWNSCLPFLENSRGVLIHRPRSVATVAKSAISKTPYMVATMWCGNSMCNSGNWTFLEVPPSNKIVCARCEEMAIQSGLPTSDELAGKHVHKGGVKAFVTCCV